MRSHILIFAIALATTAANGGSTIEVTSENSPYQLSADVLDVTQLSIAENCTLDLNGHDLTYSSQYGSGLNGISNHASTIKNSNKEKPSTLTIHIDSTTSAMGNILSKVSFEENLNVIVKAHSSDKAYLFKENNLHTGSTTLDGFNSKTQNATWRNTEYMGFLKGQSPLGNGNLVLKNGSWIHIADAIGTTMAWKKLTAASDNGNKSTNVISLANRIVSRAPVAVDKDTTLILIVKGQYPNWSGDFTGINGTLALYNAANSTAGGFVNDGETGFENAKIQFLNSPGEFQLRFTHPGDRTTQIGELSTEESISAPYGKAIVRNGHNSSENTLTVQIGSLNTDSVFYGKIADNGANGHLAIEKVGTGKLTLGGINTYDRGTTISEGTLELKGEGSLGNGNIKFAGGKLAFASDAQSTDYLERIKNSSTAPVKISVAAGKEIVWNSSLDDSNTKGVEKSGKGTLQLGENFACIQGATLTIEEGELVNHANLSSVTLRVRSDNTVKAKLVNQGKLGPVVLYKVETDGIRTTEVAKMNAAGKITYAMSDGRAREIANLTYQYSNETLVSNYASYFTTTVKKDASSNAYTYEITLKDEAKPTIGAGSDGQAATIDGDSIKFNHEKMNLKPGLYYAIGATTKPDEKATADSYNLYTAEGDSTFSLSADLPKSGVLYYKVLVSDHENWN